MILSWWRARNATGRTAAKLYGSIVAAARREEFYEHHRVPDTPEGRFALLVAHVCLVLDRLRPEGDAGRELSRALVEAFIADMDDSMREMGVGDLSVPRKVKKAAGALHDCLGAFRAAGFDNEEGLARALRETLLAGAPDAAVPSTARYMRAATAAIARQSAADLLEGRVVFPEP